MPLESASFISSLDPANPYPTDRAGQGDDHIRLIKAALIATFPKLNGAVTLTPDDLNGLPGKIADSASALSTLTGTVTAQGTTLTNLGNTVSAQGTTISGIRSTLDSAVTTLGAIGAYIVPAGGIIMWSGASVPTGWKLCDGTNGTPDLSGRFAYGTTNLSSIGTTGGTTTATTGSAGSHSHSGVTGGTALTVDQIPAHSHGYHTGTGEQTRQSGYPGNAQNGPAYQNLTTDNAGGGAAHTHPINADGNHTHTVSVMPPYYALAFIMKS